MKRGDIIVLCAVCSVAAALMIAFLFIKSNGKTVVIKENNKIVAEYPINTDRDIVLTHNTLTVKGGKVFMSHADCKNQVCVKTGKISKKGECIVCLPNRVIAEVK